MRLNPFWMDDYSKPASLPLCEEMPEKTDVAIVGSGYTGLSAALELAKRQAHVVVLERHTIGWGASTRNGGITGCGLKRGTASMIQRYGERLGHLFWEESLRALEGVKELIRSHNIDCLFSQNGDLCLAVKASHFEEMKSKAAWHARVLRHELTIIPPHELEREIGSKAYYGGLLDEHGAALHPSRLLFGLAEAAARHGVCLCENQEVQQIKKGAQGFHLVTARGELRADRVLLATNGYTDHRLPYLQPKVMPIGSYIIVTEPLSADLSREISPQGRVFWDSKWFLNYFRLTPDGRFLWGGRNNLQTNLDLKRSADLLRQQMITAFPQLKEVRITHSWSGHLGLTFDLMPHIGLVQGMVYALGYCGHGVHLSIHLGREAARFIDLGNSDSPFLHIPHPTYPFYRGNAWFLPLVAQYYRWKDRLS